MAVENGFKKYIKREKQENGNYKAVSYWTSSETVDYNGDTLNNYLDNAQTFDRQLLVGANQRTFWGNGNVKYGSFQKRGWGDNLIEIFELGDDNPVPSIMYGYKFTTTPENTGNSYVGQDGIKVVVGQKYTMSCYARSAQSIQLRLTAGTTDGPTNPLYTVNTTPEWKRYKFTFTINESFLLEDGTLRVYYGMQGYNNSGIAGVIELCGIVFNEGEIPTQVKDYDDYVHWSEVNAEARLYPKRTFKVVQGDGINSQGICGDDDFLYVTIRDIEGGDSAPTTIYKCNKETGAVVDTIPAGTGHFNNLSLFNGKIYGTGCGDIPPNDETNTAAYNKIAAIDIATKQRQDITLPYDVWGMDIYQFSRYTAPVVTFNKAYASTFEYYVGFHVPTNTTNPNDPEPLSATDDYHVPLCNVNFPIKQGTFQGAFKCYYDYILAVWAGYRFDRPMAKNMVVGYSYSGKELFKLYFGNLGLMDELEDVYLDEANEELYVNTSYGIVYVYDMPKLHLNTVSSLAKPTSMVGVVKHAYVNGNPLDSYRRYTRTSNGATQNIDIYYKLAFSEHIFTDDFGSLAEGYLNVNGQKFPLYMDETTRYLYSNGIVYYTDGSYMYVDVRFTRSYNEARYFYELTDVVFRLMDHTGWAVSSYTGTISSGGTTSDATGSIGAAFAALMPKGWISKFYVNSIDMITGMRRNWVSLPKFL